MEDFIKEKKLSDLKKKQNIVRLNSYNQNNYKSLNYQEIIDMPYKATNYILYPWLPDQGTAFLYSATGVGKTYFSLNCAYSIAQGGNFLKFSAPNPKKVLYIDGELQLSNIIKRIKSIINEQGPLDIPDNFQLLNHQMVYPHLLPKLNDLSGHDFYTDYINDNNFDVVFFDNISTLSTIDENFGEQWVPIINLFLKLRAMGKTVVGIHHTGKNKYEFRGSCRILDIVDTSILLTSNKNDRLESDVSEGADFKIIYKKDRVLSGKDSIPFNVLYHQNKWTIQSAENANIQYVVESIKNKISHQMIATELGVSRQYVSKLVKKAKEMNLLND